MSSITESSAWQQLETHAEETAGQQMRELFAADPQRFVKFSLQFDDLLFDFSKNRITNDTLPLLCKLACEAGVIRCQ